MRVVTTCHKTGLDHYGHQWLESRDNWPKDTDFRFYTEGFSVDCPGKDVRDISELNDFKLKNAGYIPPSWEWDVVRYANKVFAAIDSLYDYEGIGVWLDADCVTYKKIPEGFVEKQLEDAYLGHFYRTGKYSETGFWIMDCSDKGHKRFLDAWKAWYLSGEFRKLPQWTDCLTLDAAIYQTGIKTRNLSGDAHKENHPMAKVELGRYIDHQKGTRKSLKKSPENRFRKV